jgi:hypothetical protein
MAEETPVERRCTAVNEGSAALRRGRPENFRASIVNEFDGRANAIYVRRDHFGGTGHVRDRDIRFDPDGDFEFQAESPEIRAPHGRS